MVAPDFGWRVAMAAEDGDRVHDGRDVDPVRGWRRDGSILPDLDDPATAGVLLEMLADALDVLSVGREDGIWFAGDGYYTHRKVHETGPTLGVAVARALLSVWEQP